MYIDDDLKNLSDDDKKRKRRAFQTEMVILDSDKRKILEQKNILEAEMRNLDMDSQRIKVSLSEKKQLFEKLSGKVEAIEEEIRRFKKKLNLL